MQTNHYLYNSDSRYFISDKKVDLVVTSPPYPMIKMWDPIFFSMNPVIKECFKREDKVIAWSFMLDELNLVWKTCDSLLKDGGIFCINIGDAFRTFKDFRVYPNSSGMIMDFQKMGYILLPSIFWNKQTNSPNKFMGSGMLPKKAYVTHEFEYILIFKKVGETNFNKKLRKESAYFFDERNKWYSNIWADIQGVNQTSNLTSRERSGAFPFEIPYRLINMFSMKQDTVLDPFAGIGTTTMAAMASERNSLSLELMSDVFLEMVSEINDLPRSFINQRILKRLEDQYRFSTQGEYKILNKNHNIFVKTSQEEELKLKQIEGWNHINKSKDKNIDFSTSYSNDLLYQIKGKFERTHNSLRRWI